MKSSYQKRNGGIKNRYFSTNDGPRASERRRKARVRLVEQLASGKKPNKEGPGNVDLSEADVARIKKEIAVLGTKLKLTSYDL